MSMQLMFSFTFLSHMWNRNRVLGSLGRQWERWGGGVVAEVNYLSTITASNNLHPSPASSLSSRPHIWASFPARSAKYSIIPKWPLPASIENLSGILNDLRSPPHPPFLSSVLPHVSDFNPLFCRWAGLDSQASGGVKRPDLPGRMLSK